VHFQNCLASYSNYWDRSYMYNIFIKNKTSCGYHSLSNKILKLCGSQISKHLTHIYNKSLTAGICPDLLKCPVRKPCFKESDESQISNYRPFSLLMGFSKIFELLIFHRFMWWVITFWPTNSMVFLTMFLLKALSLDSLKQFLVHGIIKNI